MICIVKEKLQKSWGKLFGFKAIEAQKGISIVATRPDGWDTLIRKQKY